MSEPSKETEGSLASIASSATQLAEGTAPASSTTTAAASPLSTNTSALTAPSSSSTEGPPTNGLHSPKPAVSPSSTSSITTPSAAVPAPPSVVRSPPTSSASRERERERDVGRDKDRHRGSRDRDSDRSHRSRDGDGDKHRERDRDRHRDREKTRDRRRSRRSSSRSRSPSPSHRSSKSSSSRSSHRSSRSRSPPRPSLPSTTPPFPSDDSREDSERARAERTVFVSQLHPKLKERDLFEFFSNVGMVEDVRLIKDQRTKRSKGLGYVEFRSGEDVVKALAMTGQLMGGYPITVQPVQYPMSKGEVVYSSDSLRLYVGSLQYQITEGDLRPLFAAFGPIDSIEVHKDPATGISKGFGFVQYSHKADAEMALKLLQHVELAGRPMKLGLATQAGSGMGYPQSSALLSPSSSAFPSLPPLPQVPSTSLLIANMFDPREETEPDWDLDIAEEMKDESAKYGALLHVHVDKNSQGHVYLRFQTVDSAIAAFTALNGRWFGGKQLMASYIQEDIYKARFP